MGIARTENLRNRKVRPMGWAAGDDIKEDKREEGNWSGEEMEKLDGLEDGMMGRGLASSRSREWGKE